jgi:hypothetical protein
MCLNGLNPKKKSNATPDAPESQHSLGVSSTNPTPDLNSNVCHHAVMLLVEEKHLFCQCFAVAKPAFNAERHAGMLLEAVQVGFDHDRSSRLQHTKADPNPNKFFEQACVPPCCMKVSEPGPRFRDNVEQVCGCHGLLPSWVVRDLCCRSC